ncbi:MULTISPECIES: MarR family transcriptional regulator [Ensifer]|uniref:MarR family transcriptional regulator n=1 Tax=Ensifer TaxID=106591 RepID=UPI00070CACC1|nr:hypothetical protein ASD52_12815 [Ensifer sp. Root142]MBD9487836.1 MarR family transcriptional regulator [Ensifer sp. ENS11]NOV16760.1 MarR family transcriptional regulator [Ensifer canadensis]
MDRSATSRLVRQLKQAGIVESRPDPADKRGVILSLTDQGATKIRAAIKYKGEVFAVVSTAGARRIYASLRPCFVASTPAQQTRTSPRRAQTW